MIEVIEYIDYRGRSPFERWLGTLDSVAVIKVRAALARLETGSLSEVRGVGGGVLERRIHFGPGYRIYFGKDGDTLIILLGGGTKSHQQNDIENARRLWREYRRSKE